jgi:hypothetical protein
LGNGNKYETRKQDGQESHAGAKVKNNDSLTEGRWWSFGELRFVRYEVRGGRYTFEQHIFAIFTP